MKSKTAFFLLFLFFWMAFPCFSQEILQTDPTVKIQNSTSAIKAMNGDGKEMSIPCISYSLPKAVEISDVIIDTTNKELMFLAKQGIQESSRNPVYLLAFNYEKNEVAWEKQSRYYKGFSGFLTKDNVIFRINSGRNWKNFAFTQKEGHLSWQNTLELKFPIMSKNIAFHGAIQCIDLSSGTIKWERKINDDYGWMGKSIFGSEMLTIIDGIHLFNLESGEGWDIPFRTGKKDADGNTLTGLASKIFLQGDRFYFANMDNVNCADYKTGTTIWQTRLPELMSGSAYVDTLGKNLLYINRGCGFINKVIHSYFVPYVLILNKTNGQILYSTSVKSSFYPIIDYFIADSSFSLLTMNDVYSYGPQCMFLKKMSASADSMIRSQTGNFLSFIDNDTRKNTYIRSSQNPKQFNSLTMIQNEEFKYFLFTEKGIVCFNSKFQKTNWIPEENIFQALYRHNGKCIVSQLKQYSTKRVIIEDKVNGAPVVNLNFLYRSSIENGYMVLYQSPSSVSVIPLENLIGK
jgi:outer membrane protein assembly factor BamB